MSAIDQTRHIALMMQQGVQDARKWECGPFMLCRIEYPYGVAWGLHILVGRYGFQIGTWEQWPQ